MLMVRIFQTKEVFGAPLYLVFFAAPILYSVIFLELKVKLVGKSNSLRHVFSRVYSLFIKIFPIAAK